MGVCAVWVRDTQTNSPGVSQSLGAGVDKRGPQAVLQQNAVWGVEQCWRKGGQGHAPGFGSSSLEEQAVKKRQWIPFVWNTNERKGIGTRRQCYLIKERANSDTRSWVSWHVRWFGSQLEALMNKTLRGHLTIGWYSLLPPIAV